MRNLLPCKKTNQNNCDGQTTAPTVIYEDLTEVLQRTNPNHNTGHIKHPSLEMIDVKNCHYQGSGYSMAMNAPIFLCSSSSGPDPYCSQELYNPIYEELSDAETELAHGSEDDFAEDELSLNGIETRTLQSKDRNQQSQKQLLHHHCHCYTTSLPYKWNNKDNRYEQSNNTNNSTKRSTLQCVPVNNTVNTSVRRPIVTKTADGTGYRNQNEFHEGILFDSLLQMYPHLSNDINNHQSVAMNNRTNNRNSTRSGLGLSKKLQKFTKGKRLKSCSRAQVSQQQPSLPTITMVSNDNPATMAHFCSNNHTIVRKQQQLFDNSYESVPVLEQLASFRPMPKPYSQDSAFGSDSGYSNNTNCCGMNTSGTGSSRSHNRNMKRLSQISTDLS